MTECSVRRGFLHPRPTLLAAGAAAMLGLFVGGRDAAAATTLTTDDQLVGTVRQALTAHDLDTLESLVDWDGATPMRRRLVAYQMRYGFGRPIRSIALEPFPADGFDAMRAQGKLVPNMLVTQQLRVVFDEPGNEAGITFLIGRQQQAYRIALVVPARGTNPAAR